MNDMETNLSRKLSKLLLGAACLALVPACLAAPQVTHTWINPYGGNFSDTNNWDPTTPLENNGNTILNFTNDIAYTVTNDYGTGPALTLTNMHVTAGTLQVVGKNLKWEGTGQENNMVGGVNITTNATVVFDGFTNTMNSGNQRFYKTGGGRLILTNGATINVTGTIFQEGEVILETNAVIITTVKLALPNPKDGFTNQAIMTLRKNASITCKSSDLMVGNRGPTSGLGYGFVNVQDDAQILIASSGNQICLGRTGKSQGTLNQSGGVVTTPTLALGAADGSSGTYNLNGGRLNVGAISRPNANGKPTMNLNGGTLNFSSSINVPSYIKMNVMGNGAFITTDFTATLTNALAKGDNFGGGLTKSGPGTLILKGTNTYTGATVVSAGQLLVDGLVPAVMVSVRSGATLGGLGTIAGPVLVENGGTLAVGETIGALTFGSTLTLAAGSTNVAKVNSDDQTNDQIVGAYTFTYGGTLVVNNIGTSELISGASFKIFSANDYQGSFARISPSIPGPGLLWDASSLAVDGTLKIVTGTQEPPAAPSISSLVRSGADIVMVSSGATNGSCYLLSSTDVTLPLASWSIVTINQVGADGLFTNTITVTPGEPHRFYRLSIP